MTSWLTEWRAGWTAICVSGWGLGAVKEGCLRWYLTRILREMVPRETGDHRLPVSCKEGAGTWKGAGEDLKELEIRNGVVDEYGRKAAAYC